MEISTRATCPDAEDESGALTGGGQAGKAGEEREGDAPSFVARGVLTQNC